MSPQDKQALQLPHHKLIAYQVAAELLQLVARIRINDAELRRQARKSAKSAGLNTAEGVARQTLADTSRAYAIARKALLAKARDHRSTEPFADLSWNAGASLRR